MTNALLGGLLIGLFVINWLGVFVLPVIVAIYQCIALFLLLSRKGIDPIRFKQFGGYYSQLKYEEFASKWTKFIDRTRVFVIQFGWTYITTTICAAIVYFIKNLIS